MSANDLESTARALVAEGKGILAADESGSTIEKRFKTINLPSTEDNRRAYRELLFTAAGIAQYISGVILYDETIRQKASNGTPLVEVLRKQGIIPGIKVDKGAKALAGSPQEKITEGLDGLRERLDEYARLGARFAKWRAVITIGAGMPSAACIKANADALARYAAICIDAGIVPIVEPEVLMDGDHTIERCFDVTEQTLHRVFEDLYRYGVPFEQMLLKPNMVISGQECPAQADVEEVAAATVRCLKRCVPAAVPGVVFLSGGQSAEKATAHLNAMNAGHAPLPWQLSFSYGRALQDAPLKTWRGEPGNVRKAQEAFHLRAKLNGAARSGSYGEEMERQPAVSGRSSR